MKAKVKQYQSPYWAMDNIDDFRLNPTALKALPPIKEHNDEYPFTFPEEF